MELVKQPSQDDIITWVKQVEHMVHGYYEHHFPLESKPSITVTFGLKYARIVQTTDVGTEDESNSAWGFISMSNGDVLKANTWGRPHPIPRGNIFVDTPVECCSWTGPLYLRRRAK